MRVLDGERWLTPQEAGGMLGVSYKTLGRWSDQGKRRAWVDGCLKEVPFNVRRRTTLTGYRLFAEQDVIALRAESERSSPISGRP